MTPSEQTPLLNGNGRQPSSPSFYPRCAPKSRRRTILAGLVQMVHLWLLAESPIAAGAGGRSRSLFELGCAVALWI